jgi:hypothetical protein
MLELASRAVMYSLMSQAASRSASTLDRGRDIRVHSRYSSLKLSMQSSGHRMELIIIALIAVEVIIVSRTVLKHICHLFSVSTFRRLFAKDPSYGIN